MRLASWHAIDWDVDFLLYFCVNWFQCGIYSVWDIFSVGHIQCGTYSVWDIFSVGHIQCGTYSVFEMARSLSNMKS